MTFEDWYDRQSYAERSFLRTCWLNSLDTGELFRGKYRYVSFEEYLREVYEKEVANV